MNAIRKLARNVAKTKMKKDGISNICGRIARQGGDKNSKFAIHWREAVKWGTKHESV